MLNKFVPILMIALLLVCPAMGGRCCDAAGMGDAAGVGDATVEAVQSCHDCPCHETPGGRSLPTPSHHDCPQSCHDCICEGALPAGPTATDSLESQPILVDFVFQQPVALTTLLHRTSLRFDLGPPPISLGERLATLCSLRI